jgi:hypothetical protein
MRTTVMAWRLDLLADAEALRGATISVLDLKSIFSPQAKHAAEARLEPILEEEDNGEVVEGRPGS